MFSSILTIPVKADAKADELFGRFTQTPGLIDAFQLEAANGAAETVIVSIWEDEQAVQAYLKRSDLKKEVDKTYLRSSRSLYRVRGSKLDNQTSGEEA